MNSPHKGQWRGTLKFSLICAWINGWVNNREAGDLRRHRAHYDATVMWNCVRRYGIKTLSALLAFWTRNQSVNDGFPYKKGPPVMRSFYFLCCLPEHAVEPTVEFRMIWNDLTLSWRRCNMSIVPVPRFMLPILCITLRSSRQTSCGKKNYGVWKPKFSLSGTGSRYHSHTV